MYEPAPTIAEMKKTYEANPFAQGSSLTIDFIDDFKDLPALAGRALTYCQFSNAKDEVSKKLQSIASFGPAFVYKIDKYTPVKLNNNASALIFNGGFDFQTPHELGELLYKKLQGGRGKLSTTFKYGSHCNGEAVMGSMKMPCRNSIVKQYLLNGGDVSKIDQPCVKQQPKIMFSTPV